MMTINIVVIIAANEAVFASICLSVCQWHYLGSYGSALV